MVVVAAAVAAAVPAVVAVAAAAAGVVVGVLDNTAMMASDGRCYSCFNDIFSSLFVCAQLINQQKNIGEQQQYSPRQNTVFIKPKLLLPALFNV